MKYKNKEIGDLDDDGTLTKRGKQVQLMRNMDGFGLSIDILEHPEIERVKIHFDGKIYMTDLETFDKKGIYYNHKDFEPQKILPRKYFSISDPNQKELF